MTSSLQIFRQHGFQPTTIYFKAFFTDKFFRFFPTFIHRCVVSAKAETSIREKNKMSEETSKKHQRVSRNVKKFTKTGPSQFFLSPIHTRHLITNHPHEAYHNGFFTRKEFILLSYTYKNVHKVHNEKMKQNVKTRETNVVRKMYINISHS